MRSFCRALVGCCLSALVVLGASSQAGAITKVQLASKALSATDLPTGWSLVSSSASAGSEPSCLKGVKKSFKHEVKSEVSFSMGAIPELNETIETGPGIAKRYDKFTVGLRSCKSITLHSAGTTLSGSVAALPFPTVGNRSQAFALPLSAKGVSGPSVFLDYVFFQVGSIIGVVEYADLSQPTVAVVKGFVTEAVRKLEGKSVTPPTVPPTTVSSTTVAPTT